MTKMTCLLFLTMFVLHQVHCNSGLSVEDKCREETKLSETKFMASFREENISEQDEEYGKHFHCVWLKRGLLNNDGSINKVKVGEFLENEIAQDFRLTDSIKEKFRKDAEECSKIESSSVQGKAVKLKNCITSSIRSFVPS
ncbi:hypothetical protein RI129_003952 [Pyrocoelia pectoralis]|uniref:Uncharacterized protein n=1 Tax=Pyrocoelia pectoralis TaxID=417401 RepID=A0AAN7VHR1_9COLE